MEFILKNKKLFAILFWAWVAAITYFTVVPSNPELKVEIKEGSFRLDYIMHFIAYFGLSMLYLFWKADNLLNVRLKYLMFFLIAALVLSGIGEYIQTYIPGRTFNPVDYYCNAAGIIAGIVAPKLVFFKKSISK